MKNQIKTKKIFSTLLIVPLVLLMAFFALPKPAFAETSVDIQWDKYEPCNELSINANTSQTTIIAGKTTGNNPVVIWCSELPDKETQGKIEESFKGNPGVGNPKSFTYISGDSDSAYGMTVSVVDGKVMFDAPHKWSLLYTGMLTQSTPSDTNEDVTENENVSEGTGIDVNEGAGEDTDTDSILDGRPDHENDNPGQELVESDNGVQETLPATDTNGEGAVATNTNTGAGNTPTGEKGNTPTGEKGNTPSSEAGNASANAPGNDNGANYEIKEFHHNFSGSIPVITVEQNTSSAPANTANTGNITDLEKSESQSAVSKAPNKVAQNAPNKALQSAPNKALQNASARPLDNQPKTGLDYSFNFYLIISLISAFSLFLLSVNSIKRHAKTMK